MPTTYDFSHLTHPLGAIALPPLTIQKVEWETRDWGEVLKVTFAESFDYGNITLNTMHFLRFAEDANGQYPPEAEAFFWFTSRLNQTAQIPLQRTFLDEQGYVYWVLSDEVVEEIKAEKAKWSALSCLEEKELIQENKEKVDQESTEVQNWREIHERFDEKYYGDKTYQQEWEKEGFTYSEAQNWILAGFKPDDYYWVRKWKEMGDVQHFKEWNQVGFEPGDYNKVKEWKNQAFAPLKAKSWREIGLKPTLKYDYFNYAELAAYLRSKGHRPTPDLNIEQIREKGIPAQEYLDCFYPQDQRKTIRKLYVNNKNLTGTLDCSDFINLEELYCHNNQLTSLNVDKCLKLKKLSCEDNNLLERDLSMFSHLDSLEELRIGNGSKEKIKKGIYNRFKGSLEPLKNLTKLRILRISHTDINSGAEYLPSNLKEITYFTWARPQSKVKEIRKQLDLFGKYGLCQKCRQPNIGKDWCYSCNSTGDRVVDDFIQKQQIEFSNTNSTLGWIPYEQFTEIEYLDKGGFAKIYKAKWNNKKVVLKILNDSQNIKADFLQEIANHKLFSTSSRVVNCFGISQDLETKSYIMVMDYIKDRDLRKFLKDNQLTFQEKLSQLWRIADGLRIIHQQNLTHRDFHSGNILNRKDKVKGTNDIKCYITDLGLCKPINEENQEEKVFGVMPYVAPELLSKKAGEPIPYTQASDIYSFGIIAYEILAGLPPYYNLAHDPALGARICNGLRPKFQIKIPQLLEDLIKRCWDTDSQKRPTAWGLAQALKKWKNEDAEFKAQLQAAEEYNQTLPNEIRLPEYKIHPGASYHSKLLPTKEITNLLQSFPTTSEQFYTAAQSLSIDLSSSMATESPEQELTNQTKRQLSLESQAKTNQGEAKLPRIRITEDQPYQSEPMELDADWTNLHPHFNSQLIQAWQNQGFTYQQARDWINIHAPTDQLQAIQEPEFYAWLRDIKRVDSDWVLNHGNMTELKQEYQAYQQTPQILHQPLGIPGSSKPK